MGHYFLDLQYKIISSVISCEINVDESDFSVILAALLLLADGDAAFTALKHA